MDSLPQQDAERKELIGDDWLDLQSTDYLEPIYRLDLERASNYASTHKCSECRAQLIAVDDGDKYQIICPNGHDVTTRTVITNTQAQIAEDNETFGRMAINAASRPKRTEAEILKEMGF